MKPASNLQLAFRSLLLVAPLTLAAPRASAQDSLVAIARVGPDGTLYHGENTVGGDLLASRVGVGDYELILLAPNAFLGAAPEDFVIHATLANSASDDKIASVHVHTVAPDFLNLRVRVADVEDSADPDGPAASDGGFHFTLHRIRGGTLDRASRFVAATGQVSADGTLLRSAHAEGYTLSSSRSSDRNYELVLARPGAFAGDVAFDYVLGLGTFGSNFNDRIVRGNPVVVSGDDEVVFRILVDEAQDDANPNLAVPTDRDFGFVIHRLPQGSDAIGPSESGLLLALARIDGTTAGLLRGASAFPGAALIAQRNGGAGRFRLTIVAPGRFAGRHGSEFVALPQVQASAFTDRFASAQVQVFDADTLHLNVMVNDVESSGTGSGVPTDASFSVALYDARAAHQADLMVGRGAALPAMRGDNLYRANAAGQRLRLRVSARRTVRCFHAAENDGNVTGRLRVFAREPRRGARVRHFRIGGGNKVNVTASMRGAGGVVAAMAPGTNLRFESRIRFAGKRVPKSWRLVTRAASFGGGTSDASRVLAGQRRKGR